MAAAILHSDHWLAGMQLMQGVKPEGWARVFEGSDLVQTNRKALQGGGNAAARRG
jgi:hypothetical protein